MDENVKPAGAEPLLSVRHLTVDFHLGRDRVRPVDDVSFDLASDETIGIVGESGSGKSVLVRSVMGVIGPSRTVRREGSVTFEGTKLTALRRRELRALWGQRIGMILQDSMSALNPVRTVGAQLTETLRKHSPGLSRRDARARARDLLASVGLSEPDRRLDSHPFQLSGGMRQRVTIALALCGDIRLLIADEPTTALDVTVQHQVLNLLAAKRAEREMSLLLVTHDLGVIAGRTDRVIVMYAGEIVEISPTARLFTACKMPYTAALLEALPTFAQQGRKRLRPIPGGAVNLQRVGAGCRFAPRCVAAHDQCFAARPPLVADPADAGHLYRCWTPVGSPQYEQVRQRGPVAVTTIAPAVVPAGEQ